MKKTILTTAAVAAALLASPVAKADSMLELVSGGVSSPAVTGSGALSTISFDGPVGSWLINITGGDASQAPLTIDVSSQDSGVAVTAPLFIYFSTGSYLGFGTGAYDLFTQSASRGTYTITASVYNESGLYNGNPASLPAAFASESFSGRGSAEKMGSVGNINYYTEVIEINPNLAPGGSSAESVSLDSNFSWAPLPDGGTTVGMLGLVMVGFVGIRSKFSKRA